MHFASMFQCGNKVMIGILLLLQLKNILLTTKAGEGGGGDFEEKFWLLTPRGSTMSNIEEKT